MNRIISDTAEYDSYLFYMLSAIAINFMSNVDINVIGKPFAINNGVDNLELIKVNHSIQNHPIEFIGEKLRFAMQNVKKL